MNNPPAFPSYEYQESYGQMMAVGGMTLRDYFAAKAMQVALAELWAQAVRVGEPHKNYISDTAAKFSYEVADAMMKAREA
jgi:hypothetical protein